MRKLLACLSAPGFLLLVACGGDEGSSTAKCQPPDAPEKTMTSRVVLAEDDYDDPSQPDALPFPDNIGPLLAAFENCLSAQEAAGLELN